MHQFEQKLKEQEVPTQSNLANENALKALDEISSLKNEIQKLTSSLAASSHAQTVQKSDRKMEMAFLEQNTERAMTTVQTDGDSEQSNYKANLNKMHLESLDEPNTERQPIV